MGFGILKARDLVGGSVKASIWLLITALIKRRLSNKFLCPEIYSLTFPRLICIINFIITTSEG